MTDLGFFDPIPAGAGVIGLLSSDEFTARTAGFDRAVLDEAGSLVAVLFCADHRHAGINARHARKHLEPLGAHPFPLEIEHRPARTRALPDFDVLYIPGGSPAELLECIEGSPLWPQVVQRWRAGAALVGSSAGAMALCAHSMVPRPGDDHPTTWGKGAGPLERVALAVHATSRSKRWLQQMATDAPVPIVAIDDATGVLLAHGAQPRIVGDGKAWRVKAQ